MLFKFLGTALVFTACLGLGISKTDELKERVKYLESMHNSIIILENEIRFSQTVLISVFEKISLDSYGVIKQLFKQTALLAKDSTGEPLSSVWREVTKKLSADLNKDDIPLINEFSEYLGNYDVDGQIRGFQHYERKLAQAEQCAKETYEKNKKLYKSLGVYGGILITALLI